MGELYEKMTENVKKCRNIGEKDPELQKIEQFIEEKKRQDEEIKSIPEDFNFSDTTSIRLTPELMKKLGQFIGKSDRFNDRSSLIRAILGKFFTENDPLSTEFRGFFE